MEPGGNVSLSKLSLHQILDLIDAKVADVPPMVVYDAVAVADSILMTSFQVLRVDFKSAKGKVAAITRDGLCVVTPEEGDAFMIENVTVGEFYLVVELMDFAEKCLRKIDGHDAIGILRHARYEIAGRPSTQKFAAMGAEIDELPGSMFFESEGYELTYRPYPDGTGEKFCACLERKADGWLSNWFRVDTLRLYGVLMLMGFASKKG